MYPEDVNGVNSSCDWFPCNGDYQHGRHLLGVFKVLFSRGRLLVTVLHLFCIHFDSRSRIRSRVLHWRVTPIPILNHK
jgi:hypothetical protein